MRGKRFNLGVTGVLVATLVISIAFTGGCTKQPNNGEPSPFVPTPPTDPVTPGYIRDYDYILGYGFEYPEDWESQVIEVVDGEDVESVLMFTKPGTPTTLIVTIKLSNLTSLEERQIVVNGREGYEVIYKPIAAVKIRQVTFIVANGKSYILICSTAEVLYDEYEETFNNVINSFVIKYYDSS